LLLAAVVTLRTSRILPCNEKPIPSLDQSPFPQVHWFGHTTLRWSGPPEVTDKTPISITCAGLYIQLISLYSVHFKHGYKLL